jgi:hypothetical protein
MISLKVDQMHSYVSVQRQCSLKCRQEEFPSAFFSLWPTLVPFRRLSFPTSSRCPREGILEGVWYASPHLNGNAPHRLIAERPSSCCQLEPRGHARLNIVQDPGVYSPSFTPRFRRRFHAAPACATRRGQKKFSFLRPARAGIRTGAQAFCRWRKSYELSGTPSADLNLCSWRESLCKAHISKCSHSSVPERLTEVSITQLQPTCNQRTLQPHLIQDASTLQQNTSLRQGLRHI